MKEKNNISSKKTPVLTILVPVYNTEKYIKKCLLSLANTKLENKIEVIIVSDGSKDKSIKIAKGIQKKYPNIFSIIEKENGGHGSTINVGIKVAKGKFFRVLDSDDWFDKNEFVDFVSKLEKCKSDLVITDYSKEYVNDGISETIEYKKLTDSVEYDFDSFDLSLLDGQFFAMATITYKTDILKSINLELPEKTFYVDMIYDVFPIVNIKTFTYYKNNIYKYYIGRIGQSVNTTSYAKNHLNHDNVTHLLVDFYSSNIVNLSEVKQEYLGNIIKAVINTNYAIYCIFNRKKIDSYRYAKNFDFYLKNTSIELYNNTNTSIIKFYRKTKFILILLVPNFLKMFLYRLSIKNKNKGGN